MFLSFENPNSQLLVKPLQLYNIVILCLGDSRDLIFVPLTSK